MSESSHTSRRKPRGDGAWTARLNGLIDRIAEIGPLATAVYLILFRHADRKTGECWPSARTIAQMVGRKTRAVHLAILKLAGAKLIAVEPQRAPSGRSATTVYRLLDSERNELRPATPPSATNCARPCEKLRPAAQPVAHRTRTKEQEPRNENQRARARIRFVPPTVDEVAAYCKQRGNSIDPEGFVAYYQANGWVQSSGRPVKDWKACMITFEKNQKKWGLERSNGRKISAADPRGNLAARAAYLKSKGLSDG